MEIYARRWEPWGINLDVGVSLMSTDRGRLADDEKTGIGPDIIK
jgi:hypothetical protein